MARTFVRASNMALTLASAVKTGAPFTLAAWWKPVSIVDGNYHAIMTLDDGSANYFALYQNSSGSGAAYAYNAGTSSGAQNTTPTFTAGAWNHAAAVYAGTSSRTAYINGTKGATEVTGITPASISKTNIGRLWTLTNPADGEIAEAAIWDVALDDFEVAGLAKGYCPMLVRPQSLLAYWPIFGNNSPELDRWRNSYAVTLANSPAKSADHPRMSYCSVDG